MSSHSGGAVVRLSSEASGRSRAKPAIIGAALEQSMKHVLS